MTLLTDTRYALRRLMKSPGYVLATVAMLALGIAISSTMFGVLRGVLGSLPFPASEQLVVINGNNPQQSITGGGLTPAEVLRLEKDPGPLAQFGFFNWGGLTVIDGDRPREFTVAVVSEGFFPTLGSRPQLGRWFEASEFEPGSTSLVLSHGEWQRLLGGRPDAIGQILETDDARYQVVGVMGEDFAVPSNSIGAWLPNPQGRFPADQPWVWNARFMNGVGRLPAGAQADDGAVEAQLRAISEELAVTYSMPKEAWRLSARPMLDVIVGDVRSVLWGAFAIALLVLLIGCANVAILIDSRQVARRHEQAVVQALGASRWRIHAGLLLELVCLALIAVVLGVVLAQFGIEALRELARGSLPRVDAIAIDAEVLTFAVTLGLLLPVVALAAGALRLRGEAMDAVRGGSGKGVVGHGGRARRLLPTVGIALSTVSLVAGSALLVSLLRLSNVDPGFRHEQVYALQLFYPGEPQQQRTFVEAMQERLAALPSVEQVAVTTAAPLSLIGSFSADLILRGRSEPEPYQIGIRRVDPNYLRLLDIPLLAGRGISSDDRAESEQVAVINRELARRLFGEESPLDQVLMLPLGRSERVAYRIVGVSDNIHNDGLRAEPGPELLISLASNPTVGITFLLRASKDIAGYEALLKDALFEVDPRMAATRIFALGSELDRQLQSARFFARTIGAFALSALLLAALGVYAVAALQQQQRIAEYGLRVALGALPSNLAARIVAESMRTLGIGVVIGLGGAWLALRLLQAQLFGISGIPVTVILLGISTLACAALLAVLAPALRAARVHPMTALRHE